MVRARAAVTLVLSVAVRPAPPPREMWDTSRWHAPNIYREEVQAVLASSLNSTVQCYMLANKQRAKAQDQAGLNNTTK